MKKVKFIPSIKIEHVEKKDVTKILHMLTTISILFYNFAYVSNSMTKLIIYGLYRYQKLLSYPVFLK